MFDPIPELPPGMDRIAIVLNWIAWGVQLIAVGGFVIGIGMLITGALSGREQQGMKMIIFAIVGAIMLGAVGTIMRALV